MQAQLPRQRCRSESAVAGEGRPARPKDRAVAPLRPGNVQPHAVRAPPSRPLRQSFPMTTRFHGLELQTAPGRVFTPRSTTEALVDAALARIDDRPVRVADVGTGSGAIAVAIAVAAPNAEVWATD